MALNAISYESIITNGKRREILVAPNIQAMMTAVQYVQRIGDLYELVYEPDSLGRQAFEAAYCPELKHQMAAHFTMVGAVQAKRTS